MILNANNVRRVVTDCLFHPEELPLDGSAPSNTVAVSGITRRFEFHPGRLETNKNEIHGMLKRLPLEFQKKTGGGMSFLRATFDDQGQQWATQIVAEELMILGLAVGVVEYCIPRELWNKLPGRVPYFVVKDIA